MGAGEAQWRAAELGMRVVHAGRCHLVVTVWGLASQGLGVLAREVGPEKRAPLIVLVHQEPRHILAFCEALTCNCMTIHGVSRIRF